MPEEDRICEGRGNKSLSINLEVIFNNVEDWKIQVDLKSQVEIPTEIMQINLRPDIVMLSAKTNRLGIIKFKVPQERKYEYQVC